MKEFSRFRSSNRGSFIVDRRGVILGFDEAMEQLTQWPAIEVVGRHKDLGSAESREENGRRRMVHPPIYDGSLPAVKSPRNLELRLNCRDGRTLEVEALADRLAGPGERVVITILRVSAQLIRPDATAMSDRVDRMTGLSTAEAFTADLRTEFELARQAGRPLALILVDIDHLREINDRYGHATGDDVLRMLAGIFRVSVGPNDRLGRLAEDDFAIMLPGAGRGDARQLATTVRSKVERHHFLPRDERGRHHDVTLSIGAASHPADAENAEDLMERAREALNEARSMGRNRVWCYLRRPRVPVQVPVYFDSSETSLLGYSRDLSPSGVFVQTSAPIDIGMRCALAFPLPGRQGKVHVIGRVVRTIPPSLAHESVELRIPGMGFEFERFGGRQDRRAIESFVHENESRSLRPENGILSIS